MTRFRKVPFVAWTVFLAVFLPGSGIAGESVLCFGVDGHVAVEAAVSPGSCSSASVAWGTSGNAPERELSREADHCGPCADVPSLSGPWANTTFSSQLSGHTALSAMATSPTTLQNPEIHVSAGEGLLALRLDPPVTSFVFLRTTVLLI